MDKVNLLLVDDNPNNLLVLCTVLERPDYNLVCVGSGADALDALKRDEFALVLLDVMMPEMDGFEVAKRMKADMVSRYIPIIFVTAIARDLREIYRGYATGGVDYILKPLEPDIVKAKVATFVELFRQKKEIERTSELIRKSEKAQFLEREHVARMKAEDAEARFRNLVNALDHAIVWEAPKDLSYFTFISERVEKLLGFPQDKWLTETHFFMKRIFEEDRPKVLECINSVTGESVHNLGKRCDHRMISADGNIRWFHTGIQDERDRRGKVVKLRGLCVEISPMKRVEEQLRRAIQAREEIVSTVAHDLRTPLTAADLGASLLTLETEKQGLGELNRRATQIRRAISHTIELADNILDVERIENGAFNIESSEYKAGEIIDDAVELFEPLVAEKAIELQFEGDRGCSVNCDRARILQVLSNLLSNALKFSPSKSEIKIRVEKKDGAAWFSVQDRGSGIPQDQVKNVFERYWQGKTSHNHGLGLGLTISKGIIEAHGGEIWAESREGSGSTFHFRLPINPAEPSM